MEGSGSNQEQSLDNAIRALREKKQVPEIDFTIHEMEDGSQVNTQERVCKGESCSELHRCCMWRHEGRHCSKERLADRNLRQTYKRPRSALPPKNRSHPLTTDRSPTSHFSSSTCTEKVVLQKSKHYGSSTPARQFSDRNPTCWRWMLPSQCVVMFTDNSSIL